MSADLHIHSNCSDGTETPGEVVVLAQAAGLTTIALTDHDNIDGIVPAQQRGNELGIEVIAGVEFTTEASQAELHILGYFIDPAHPGLLAELAKIQRSRTERIYQTVAKLGSLGIDISAAEVLALSGQKCPGRPHVARIMVNKGIVPNFKEAFNRYLDYRGPAYVPHYRLGPEEAISLIKAAGGVAVFAHPGVSNCDHLIVDLMSAGLEGLEVFYAFSTLERIEHYKLLAKKNGLLMTGGSDYHGYGSGREVKLGDVKIEDNLVQKLKRAHEHLRRN